MTTLDVSIHGEGHGIDLANGLWGGATKVFTGAQEAYARGDAHGTMGPAGCHVTMKGSVLRVILGPGPPEEGYPMQSRPEEVWEFIQGIRDEGDYTISALEV